MARSNDKKKGMFSKIFGKTSPEEAERAKMRATVDALQSEREDVLDSRRDLKTNIDRFTARAKAKKKDVDGAAGPKKKILDRELASILRPLQGLVKQDDRLEARLGQLDSLLDRARETMAVKTSGITDEVIEDIIDATAEAISAEEERQEMVNELADLSFETSEQVTSTDDMLADLGLDLDEEEAPETVAPQAEAVPQREETIRQPDKTERISEGNRELDRLMAELDEDDD